LQAATRTVKQTVESALTFLRERVQSFWDADLGRQRAELARQPRGDHAAAEADLKFALEVARHTTAVRPTRRSFAD
jgi:hypothetical protein